MKVIYTAPNRGHHYRYATALNNAGILHKFVSGFSRWSPRAAIPDIGNKLIRADILQNIYLASLKFKVPIKVSAHLAYLAKVQQDNICERHIEEADIFMFYNGSGLNTCKKAKTLPDTITVAEAVNSHVHYQEELLKDEYLSLGLPWQPFDAAEKRRRMEEFEIADRILLPSEFVKRSFIGLGFPADKLIKVPYGFNRMSKGVEDTSNDIKRSFTILYVGSISVRKGLRYLIEAFRSFKHPNKKLVIVGPKAKASGLEDISIPESVIFTGPLKGDDLENAYRSADVFCLPSIEEGLALVLGEALSFGIPIIATQNTGADDIITDGEEGFIVPIRNGGAIAEKLQLLADDDGVFMQMKERALITASSLKGWDETEHSLVEELTKLYTAK
ncbi:glycosyltransferase family 4 protein [Mucilaginibacter daejeonensis]|uniref:glycosyltransferase family 4 protein n=1 Tax=Mucilaginibacter daejeonensis TaxID=398049 RepID=UPI001D17086A|nr:glycosyltransferase family 4 protein [Mucilaginibacter daejeonensis]UEG52655.1 glycosyltransferase family 4 protein [Mucilaginibacter daejeonensis]